MTKKHFKILAEEISKIIDINQRLITASVTAIACTKINPRFDKQKFFEACGL